MEKTKIEVIMRNERFEILDDSPDFSKVLEYIIDNSDFDINELTIETSNAKFDVEIFKATLIETFLEIKNKLKINKERFDELIEEKNKLNN